MKKTIETHEYTCDICREKINKDDLLIIKIPTQWNLGEDGYSNGAYEWHLHDCFSKERCAHGFAEHIEEKFRSTQIGL